MLKQARIYQWAAKIADHADARWVAPVFFLIFLVDSFVMFIPTDSILGASISLSSRHVKKWSLYSTLGILLGIVMVILLTQSHLQPWVLQWVYRAGWQEYILKMMSHVQEYGYIELTVAMYTVLPSMVGVLLAIMLGLDPIAVFGIASSAKILRLILVLLFVYTGKTWLKKFLEIFLKTPV